MSCEHPKKTAVINGVFQEEVCLFCTHTLRSTLGSSATYSRQRDREDHRKDIIQPWAKGEAPNRDFIQAYPDKARDYFNEEELKQSGV